MMTDSEVQKVIGSRIKARREELKLSRRKVSLNAGLDEGGRTLRRIEAGCDYKDIPYQFTPSLSTIIKIANALSISLEDLFAGL